MPKSSGRGGGVLDPERAASHGAAAPGTAWYGSARCSAAAAVGRKACSAACWWFSSRACSLPVPQHAHRPHAAQPRRRLRSQTARPPSPAPPGSPPSNGPPQHPPPPHIARRRRLHTPPVAAASSPTSGTLRAPPLPRRRSAFPLADAFSPSPAPPSGRRLLPGAACLPPPPPTPACLPRRRHVLPTGHRPSHHLLGGHVRRAPRRGGACAGAHRGHGPRRGAARAGGAKCARVAGLGAAFFAATKALEVGENLGTVSDHSPPPTRRLFLVLPVGA